MPNDAKLGLVIGVALVIAVAVLFYRKEPQAPPGTAQVQSSEDAAAVVRPAEAPPGAPHGPYRPAPAKTTQNGTTTPAGPPVRQQPLTEDEGLTPQ